MRRIGVGESALLAPISESITTATNQIAALPSFVVLRQNVEIAFLALESAQSDFTVVEATRTQTYADIKLPSWASPAKNFLRRVQRTQRSPQRLTSNGGAPKTLWNDERKSGAMREAACSCNKQ